MPLSTSSLSEQNKILTSIDAFIALTEKYPNNVCQNNNEDVDGMSFLFSVLNHLGTDDNVIANWIVKILKYVLPVIELGVKGILLANLKKMVDCSVNPMIPMYARTEGITFNIRQFDSSGMLKMSPLDDLHGSQLYFGLTHEEKNPYNFLRPVDANTFLWYVIHRGKYPSPTILQTPNNSYKKEYENKFTSSNVNGNSILEITTINYNKNDIDTGINVGNSFKQSYNGKMINNISVCSEIKRSEDNNAITYNKIIPVSSVWNRTNYYANRPTYFNFLDPTGTLDQTNPRNYDRDIAICSFEYVDDVNSLDDKTKKTFTYLDNDITLRILPKPLIHIPRIGQTTILPTFVLFNNKGEADANGKFSLLSTEKPSQSGTDWIYKLKYPSDGSNSNATLYVHENGTYEIKGVEGDAILPLLQECYPNLTIYEFNYDFIMSMRLFDAKTLLVQLINQILHMKMGFSFEFSRDEIEGEDRIIEIVRKIIEADDYESSDCFYTFSNDKYNEMSKNAELKYASLSPFGDDCVDNTDKLTEITDLLNQFSDESTLSGSTEKFKQLLEVASGSVTQEGKSAETKTNFKIKWKDMLKQLLLNLVKAIVKALLTPKVVLLFLVNMKLCEQDAIINLRHLTFEDFLNQIRGIIVEIVKQIRDLILREVLKFVLKRLIALLEIIMSTLLLEQTEAFRKLIRQLLDACKFGRSKDLITEIDNVDYADIDEPIAQPTTTKC